MRECLCIGLLSILMVDGFQLRQSSRAPVGFTGLTAASVSGAGACRVITSPTMVTPLTAMAAGMQITSGCYGYARPEPDAEDETAFCKYEAALKVATGMLLLTGEQAGVGAIPPVALFGGAFAFGSAVPALSKLGGPNIAEALSVISLGAMGYLARTGGLPAADAYSFATYIFTGVGMQWMLLPTFSVSVYKFPKALGDAAIRRVRRCGQALLSGGAYLVLLRTKGHRLGLAASLGLGAIFSLRRALTNEWKQGGVDAVARAALALAALA